MGSRNSFLNSTYNMPVVNSQVKEIHFTVHYSKKLYTVQYINNSIILSSEMGFFFPKTIETTCEKINFTVHGKKLYSSVQYINISVILSSEMSSLTPKTME